MLKTNTNKAKIDEILTRGVEEIINKKNLESKLLSGKQLRIKLGNDPTSPNIHIGRAILLWKLRSFQELGHKVIFIIGDFTGIIGDTSDKDSERPMLSKAQIKKNVKTYFSQVFKILDKKNTDIYYNSKWLKKINLQELGEMADLFSLHEFEARENIARRMKAGKRVSLREVLYPLMQGYDSVVIKADVEIGGTDQKFNLLSGRTIQKAYKQKPQDILTMTLIEGLDGRKMSSSWDNTINLLDSPGEMFGKIMSLQDKLIKKYFTLCTRLSQDKIKTIVKKEPRDAKIKLAKEIISLYYGKEKAKNAKQEFIKIFSRKKPPTKIKTVKLKTKSLRLIDLLVKVKLASSNGDARRLIRQGGVKINNKKKTDPQETINLSKQILIQVGPRRFVKVSKF